MVCVGQAGNQIGGAAARKAGPLSHLDLALSAMSERGDGGAPSTRVKPSGYVFVDSEPKVVRGILAPGAPAHIPFVSAEGSIVWDDNGRGNNWAWGYTGLAGRGYSGGGGGSAAAAARRRPRRRPLAWRLRAPLSARYRSHPQAGARTQKTCRGAAPLTR